LIRELIGNRAGLTRPGRWRRVEAHQEAEWRRFVSKVRLRPQLPPKRICASHTPHGVANATK
jgi:hypothetical protein